jgi:hypothetical protein
MQTAHRWLLGLRLLHDAPLVDPYPFAVSPRRKKSRPPLKPCVRISRTRLTGGLSGRCITRSPGADTLPGHSRASPREIGYCAWKRLPWNRLAAAHSRHCGCRTLPRGSRPPGLLGPVLPAIPSRLPAPATQPPQGPFPPTALFVAVIDGTTIPSDSRSTRPDFAFGLYGRARRDDGRRDGPLVFRTSPCPRAAPRTPPGPDAGSGTRPAPNVAFAVT